MSLLPSIALDSLDGSGDRRTEVDEPPQVVSIDKSVTADKYWRLPIDELKHVDGLVVIHVCDENRDITRDFCCKRDILVSYMKYFEHFLVETEGGYEDIDISVHCDIDIFEWLMAYIHNPQEPPHMDKTIVISILISSDFLQIEQLVELCLNFVANHLAEIIKLPIDLSCISEKLLTRLAQLTSAQLLAHTKDRKDKILNKLYKRRVEMDFSRKTSRTGQKSLASTLTCCVTCGRIYLDAFGSQLTCPEAETSMDFRGRLVRRHSPAADWSLTSYLKLLHAGGMNWESIYWYVWAACAVFSKDNVLFCANECSRYTCEADIVTVVAPSTRVDTGPDCASSPAEKLMFCLEAEDDADGVSWPIKFHVEYPTGAELPSGKLSPGSTAGGPGNPSARMMFTALPILTITPDLYGILGSQQKLFEATQYSQLLDNSVKATLGSIGKRKGVVSDGRKFKDGAHFDFYGVMYDFENDSPTAQESVVRGRARRGGGRVGGKSVDAVDRRTAHSIGASLKGTDGLATAGSVVDSVAGTISTKRSRSSGATTSGRKQSVSATDKGDTATADANLKSDEGSDEIDEEEEAAIRAEEQELMLENRFSVYRSMPTDVQTIAARYRGPVCGVWVTTHPIQLCPVNFLQSLTNIHENSSFSDAKRDEWALDLIREYDEKRLECMEEFLVSCRSNVDIQMNQSLSKAGGESVKGRKDEKSAILKVKEYYKDKGRQPRSNRSYYTSR